MVLFMVLEGKMMREERGAAEMIKERLYIEFASPRHDLIGLRLLGLSAESWDVRKRQVGTRPGGEEQTKTAEDTNIVSK